MTAMTTVLMLAVALAAGTPPGTPPGAAEPAPPAAGTPAAAATEPATPPAASPAPRRVWVFIDRWKEFGGTVVEESEHEIAVSDGVETRRFQKATVTEVVDLVDPKPGQTGVIQFRDGSVLRAEIVKDSADGVEFRRDSLLGKLPRSRVYRVVLEEDFEAKLARAKASIGPREFGRRLGLARWLVSEQRFDLAVAELESLLAEADVEEARDMLRDVRARIRLSEATHRQGQPDDGAEAPAVPESASPGPSAADVAAGNLLTSDDVNVIRVYELDFRDPPRMVVPPDAIAELLRTHGSSPLLPQTEEGRKALYAMPAARVAELMFAAKARELYRLIEVKEDPASLAKFRTRVHNAWLVTNCATSRCHGGTDAGWFRLWADEARDVRVRYSNLMALLSAKVDGRPMVDFERPEESILIQYALPRQRASRPHPDVQGWKPALGDGNPRLLTDSLDWIRSMYRPRPSYPVDFKPLPAAPPRPER
jgi:hypothetical protein